MAPIRNASQESWQLEELKARLGMGERLETSFDSLTSPPFIRRGGGTNNGTPDSSFCDETLTVGSRVRVLRGRRFKDFGTGDAGSITQVDREAGTCVVAFDGVNTPVQVALRHLEHDIPGSVPATAQDLNAESPAEKTEQRVSTLWSAGSQGTAFSDSGTPQIQPPDSRSPGTPGRAGEHVRMCSILPPAPSELPAQEKARLPSARPQRSLSIEGTRENGSASLQDPVAIRGELHREVARLQTLLTHEAEERAVGLEKVGQSVEQLRSRYGDVAEQIRLAGLPQEQLTLLDDRIVELMQAHVCNTCADNDVSNNSAHLEALISRVDKLEAAKNADQDRLDTLEACVAAVQGEVVGTAGATEGVKSLATVVDQLSAKLETSVTTLDQRLQALASDSAEHQSVILQLEQNMRQAINIASQPQENQFGLRQAEAFAEQCHILVTRVDALDSDFSAVQARLNGADGAVAAVHSRLAGTDALLDTLAAKMDATVSDVDNQARELQSAISQVEQHAGEAIKVGCRMSETLTEHVKLAQDKDGILDLIQARMEAFGEVEKRASEAMEIGQRVCKVMEAQSDFIDHRSNVEELQKKSDCLLARVEALNESFAAETQVRKADISRIEEVVGQRLTAEAVIPEKVIVQIEKQCEKAVLTELRADAVRAEAVRKQELDVAVQRLRSDLEVHNRAGTDAAIARLRGEFEVNAACQDPRSLSPTFARRGSPHAPVRHSRSPSPTAPALTPTRSAHSRERSIQAHWAAQPAPASERVLSPGPPGSHPRASSPQQRAISPGSPLTWSLPPPPPPPLQAMVPSTAPAWPGCAHAALGRASLPVAGRPLPAWRPPSPSTGGMATNFQHVGPGASSSSLRVLGQAGPSTTLCSLCGNMSRDDSVMCRRCTLSHSRGRARNASPVPLVAHPQPLTVSVSAAPPVAAALPTVPAVTAQQPMAATQWARSVGTAAEVALGGASTPVGEGSASTIMAPDEVRAAVGGQGLPRAESSSITNSAGSHRVSTSSTAGDSGVAKVNRAGSCGPETLESPVAQPTALAPAAAVTPAVAASS